MQFLPLLVGFVAVVSAAPNISGSFSRDSIETSVAVNRAEAVYIVQIKKEAELNVRANEKSFSSHEIFHKRAVDLDYTVRHQFTKDSIFYGLSIKLNSNWTEHEAIAKLSNIPGVANAWPVNLIDRPGPIEAIANTTFASNRTTKSFKIQSSTMVTPTDNSPILPKINGTVDVFATHRMADVDKLHKLGIKGKGIKIGIVDTGVDYTHPSLGGGFGPGHKIAGGYSFVQDSWDGYGDRIESDDPLAICPEGFHGTHVSGIIGMEDPPDTGFGLVGVAPEASIYMYRAFSCANTQSPEDVILMAIERAISDGVDVISMSLGSYKAFENQGFFVEVAKSAAEKGIAIVAALGNGGAMGAYYPSQPGSANEVIAVGSASNTVFPVTYPAKDNSGREFSYASMWPVESSQGAMDVYVQQGCEYEDWQATAAVLQNPSNTIIISAMTVECNLPTLLSFGYYIAGVPYVMAYYDSTDIWSQDPEIYLPFETTGVVVDPAIGADIVSRYKRKGGYGKYTITFNDATAKSSKLVLGGLMSNFSSFGPSWDTLQVKPQLTSPGGRILATWPLMAKGGYGIISGTSMATPFAAACYALVKSQYPKLSIPEIKNLLQASAEPIKYLENGILSTTAHQGGGMINPYKAIFYESSISPSQLDIGDTDSFQNIPYSITIKNKSSRSKTYEISHQPAGYVEYYPYPDLLELHYRQTLGQPQLPIYGSVSFSQTTIKVPAGQSATFQVTMTPPAITSKQVRQIPLFSGYVKIKNNNDIFTVPYLGAPYSRTKTPIISTAGKTITLDDGSSLDVPVPYMWNIPGWYDQDANYTFRVNTGLEIYNLTTAQTVNVRVTTLGASELIRIDVIPANTSFVPSHYGYDPSIKYEYQDPGLNATEIWLGQPSYGYIHNYGQFDWFRNSSSIPYEIEFNMYQGRINLPDTDGNGYVYVQPGDYRLLVSVLKINGELDVLGDWETWLSPVARFVGKLPWV